MIISDGQREGKIKHGTAQHVFSSVLRVLIPRIKVTVVTGHWHGAVGADKEPMPVTGDDLLQLIHQCVSLELRKFVGLIFDKLDTLSVGQSATAFEGFFVPLMRKLDRMPPGQTPGTITQKFHFIAHQLV